MSKLKYRNPDGTFSELPVINGKSAYEYAVDGGYTGTEEEFANIAGLMAVQGSENSVTTFNPDGTITESFGHGATKRTLFNEDGSITESFTSAAGVTISKTTVFNEDGSISESLSV